MINAALTNCGRPEGVSSIQQTTLAWTYQDLGSSMLKGWMGVKVVAWLLKSAFMNGGLYIGLAYSFCCADMLGRLYSVSQRSS